MIHLKVVYYAIRIHHLQKRMPRILQNERLMVPHYGFDVLPWRWLGHMSERTINVFKYTSNTTYLRNKLWSLFHSWVVAGYDDQDLSYHLLLLFLVLLLEVGILRNLRLKVIHSERELPLLDCDSFVAFVSLLTERFISVLLVRLKHVCVGTRLT